MTCQLCKKRKPTELQIDAAQILNPESRRKYEDANLTKSLFQIICTFENCSITSVNKKNAIIKIGYFSLKSWKRIYFIEWLYSEQILQ